jgi:hypothetical protein
LFGCENSILVAFLVDVVDGIGTAMTFSSMRYAFFLARATRIPAAGRFHSGVRIRHSITSSAHFSTFHTTNIMMTPIRVVTPVFSTQSSLSPPPFLRRQRIPSPESNAYHQRQGEQQRQREDGEGGEGCNLANKNHKRMRMTKPLPESVFLPFDLDCRDGKPKVISLKSRTLSQEESSFMIPASWADVH